MENSYSVSKIPLIKSVKYNIKQRHYLILNFSPAMYMTPQDGRSYCAQTYGAQMMVPNSMDEALFIGKYLSTLRVNKNYASTFEGYQRSFVLIL